jgi:hypothetical protein
MGPLYKNQEFDYLRAILQNDQGIKDIPSEVSVTNEEGEGFVAKTSIFDEMQMSDLLNTIQLGFDRHDVHNVASVLLSDVDNVSIVNINELSAKVMEALSERFTFDMSNQDKLSGAITLIKSSASHYLDSIIRHHLDAGISYAHAIAPSEMNSDVFAKCGEGMAIEGEGDPFAMLERTAKRNVSMGTTVEASHSYDSGMKL